MTSSSGAGVLGVAASVCTAARLGAMAPTMIGLTSGRLTTMVVAFVVAAVVVAPYGWKRLGPIVRERRAARAPRVPRTSPGAAGAPEAPPSPGEASTVVARVDAVVAEWPDDAESVELTVPATLTVGGRPTPLGRQLVEDAVRRSGLSVEWLGDTGSDVDVVLRLRRRD